ncbi:unnamed protein product [Paramecium primaurelia]|uniref:ubiquitinyl hydrolase 1 n=1 Tax=Paramecium primaurelia TaxID=5886 RepID=A0A8S1NUA7_PARPR|nr:unnamed protein product [Paramecium primaurelia]
MKYSGKDDNQENSDDQQKTSISQYQANKLKQQAKEMHDMLLLLKENFEDEECDIYYILSKNWFDQWKQYVSYDQVVNDQPPGNKFGQIILQNYNNDLLETRTNECFKFYPLSSNPWNIWLKPNLQEDKDYIVISQQIQNYLNQHYRGTQILRNSIGQGKNKKVVVNLFKFNATLIIPNTIIQISQDNLIQFEKEYLQADESCVMKDLYAIIQKTVPTFRGNYNNQNGVRIWRYKNQNDPFKALFAEIKKQVQDLDFNDDQVFDFSGDPIENSQDITLKSLNLTDNDLVVIEFQQSFKPWCIRHPSVPVEGKCEGCGSISELPFPCICKKVAYCSERCKVNDEKFHLPKCDPCGSDDEQVKQITINDKSVKGVAGLANLGNTCFMNSGTQCLSNTYQLTEYFITNKYFDEINEDNPLGTQGQLVRKYASLIKKLWCGDKNVVIPTSFKKAVGQFQPMFKGFQQHDSSELITFLLDGLHEDLNRVKKKPYVESKDNQGKPDFEVAKESWENHLARNQSIIVDLMHGQYKSTLKCPTCSQISITFDPFLTCGLSIPNKKQKSIQVKVIKSIVQIETKYLNFEGSKKTMSLLEFTKEQIIPEFKIDPNSELLFYTSFSNDIQGLIDPKSEINSVRKNSKRGYLVVKIINEEEKEIPAEDRIYLNYSQKALDGFGQQYKRTIFQQFYVIISKEFTLKQIHLAIFKALLPIFCDVISQNDISTPEQLRQYYEQNIQGKYYNINFRSQSAYWQQCSFCNQKNCQDCEADYKDETYQQIKTKVLENDQNNKIELIIFWIQSPFQHVKPADIYQYYQNQQYKKQMEEERNATNNDENNDNQKTKQYVMKSQNYANNNQIQKVTLQECLIQSEQPEQLAEDNAWYCKVCKEHVQAYKSMQIYKASDILIFTLKRFKASSGFFKQKLETFVEFPVKGLDLTEFILNKNRPLDYEWELKQQQKIEEELPEQNENDKNDEKLLYDLFAVSNHFGGMGGGHYTAFGKNHLNGNWYSFDDAQVSEVDEDQIVTKSAYVLFYKRRSKQQNTQDFKTQD